MERRLGVYVVVGWSRERVRWMVGTRSVDVCLGQWKISHGDMSDFLTNKMHLTNSLTTTPIS